MKILQISSAKTFGSWEQHFVDLCRGLHARGHEVFAVLRPRCEWKKELDFLPAANVGYVSIRNSFGIFSGQNIARFIRENEIEIVHCHVVRDYFPTALACRIAKTPKFVLTRHSPSPMKSFYRFSLTNLDMAIAVSKGIETDLQRLFPNDKTALIPNGFAVKDASAEALRESGNEFRSENNIPLNARLMGTIGDLKEANGQRDFVMAAQIIAEKFSGSRFAIIGEDNSINKAFRRDLKRMVKIFGLDDRFLWLNWVEDKSNFYNSLDVLVVPPRERSFAAGVIEAMANRTAIVATRTVSAKDILKDGVSGLIVPANEPVELASAINQLLEDDQFRENIGQQAQESVRKNHSANQMLDEIESVYLNLRQQIGEN